MPRESVASRAEMPLMYVDCTHCKKKHAVHIKWSKGKHPGLYGRCRQCNLLGFGSDSWMTLIRRELIMIKPGTMDRMEIKELVKDAL